MSFSTLDTVDQADRTPVSGVNANLYRPRLSDALALATKNRSRSKRSLNAKYDQILRSVKGRATSLFAKKSENERGRDGETFAGLSSIPFPRSYGMGSKVKLASLASQTRCTLPNRRNGGLFSKSISSRPIILQPPPTYSPTPSNNNSESWHARQDGSNLLYTPKTEAFEPDSYSTPYLDQQVESKTEDYHEKRRTRTACLWLCELRPSRRNRTSTPQLTSSLTYLSTIVALAASFNDIGRTSRALSALPSDSVLLPRTCSFSFFTQHGVQHLSTIFGHISKPLWYRRKFKQV
ncbi:hypothetical protein C365_06005 [Cryptococcus neoformans Bt85]|nr:hypothetical protein C365_06005 [Cryptococcus neoformans var. grubii Bt85]